MLEGKRVVMLVWNAFVSDARVLREARTLADAGAEVCVVAVRASADLPATETVAPGVHVERVARRRSFLPILPILPRLAVRRAWYGIQRRVLGRKILAPPMGRAAWWELDRKLTGLLQIRDIHRGMYRAALSWRPDVIHAHDFNTLFPAARVKARCRIPLVYDAHEISADREGYFGRVWFVRWIERRYGSRAQGRITTTKMRADWFAEHYGFRDMTVIQNRPLTRIVEGSDRIRDTFKIESSRPVVLYQGGLQSGRGLRNLLEAMRDTPQADLVFVGDGKQRLLLEAASIDIRHRVHFAGMVSLDELPDWTASADIGVQALRNTCLNHYTTDSNKLFEYVMGGLPVVASNFPEIRRIVTDHDLGLLVDPESVESLRDALRTLIDDPERRARHAANARQAREELNWESQAPLLTGLYSRVLSGHDEATGV